MIHGECRFTPSAGAAERLPLPDTRPRTQPSCAGFWFRLQRDNDSTSVERAFGFLGGVLRTNRVK
jgi:hypothetical protein